MDETSIVEIVTKKMVAAVAVVVCVVVVIVVIATCFLIPSGPPSAPYFTISLSPSTLTIPRGGSDNLIIDFQTDQLPSSLGYSVEGLPEGVQYTGEAGPWSPPSPGSPPIPPTTFVLTFTVAQGASTGSYPATVVCTDMGTSLTDNENFTLEIT